jgi:phosphoribosylaminoimidazole carboxylase (NCAIR synthetase)
MPGSILCQLHLAKLVRAKAENLGVTLEIVDFESHSLAERYSSITAASSAHRQYVSYPMVDHFIHRNRLGTEPSHLSDAIKEVAQQFVNQRLVELPLGKMYVFRFNSDGSLIDFQTGITDEVVWTLDFTVIDALENAIRAALDFPLGTSAPLVPDWRSLNFSAAAELDMVRPYLHLFAHNPRYQIHKLTTHSGFLTLSGTGNLTESIIHGVDYLEGVVNE